MIEKIALAAVITMSTFGLGTAPVKPGDGDEWERFRNPCLYYPFEDGEDRGGCVQMVRAVGIVKLEEDRHSSEEKESALVIDPCAVSNPALAGKGCLFYINEQVVVANGDGTITTAAGNIYDADGNFVGVNEEFLNEN